MIQTRLLLGLATFLILLIGIVLLAQSLHGPQATTTEARAKLCGSYYEYVDTTRDVIQPMDTMCWRGDAPVRASE